MHLNGEWWVLPDGSNIYADGDVCHASIALDYLRYDAAGILNLESEDHECHEAFLSQVSQPNTLEETQGEDPWEFLTRKFNQHSDYKHIPRSGEAACAILRNHELNDPRTFAINIWQWIRVTPTHIELPDMLPQSIKRAAEGILDIIAEQEVDFNEESALEIEMEIHSHKGSQSRTMTLRQMQKAETGHTLTPSTPFLNALRNLGKKAVDDLDAILAHPAYGAPAQ